MLSGEASTLSASLLHPNFSERIHVPCALVYLSDSPGKGRGVFAAQAIPKQTVVDISPVLLFPNSLDSAVSVEREILNHYTYTWGSSSQALALGLGSMFNHSRSHQNVGFVLDKKRGVIIYSTILDIGKDEELLISYGASLWFDDSEAGNSGSGVSCEADEEEADSEFLDSIQI